MLAVQSRDWGMAESSAAGCVYAPNKDTKHFRRCSSIEDMYLFMAKTFLGAYKYDVYRLLDWEIVQQVFQ